MKRIAIFPLISFLLLLGSEILAQGIPETINYQGVLKDASGNIVPDGNYNITFKLYDSVVGGTVLWTEAKVVNIVGGIINTQLGSVVPLNSNLFIEATWLGITIESGSELTPRIALTSTPYSFMTMNVADGRVVKSLNGLKDNINLIAGSNITITPTGNDLTIAATGGGGGGTVTQVNIGAGLTGGPITTTGTISVANDGITNEMLQNNSVTSSKIVDGTIASGDLGNNSVTSAKIVDGTLLATDVGSNQLIKSVNSIKDSVNLVAGSNISITPSGHTLTISAGGGSGGGDITAVLAGNGLDGGGTVGDVTLEVEPGGITSQMLQNNSVTSTKIVDATITTADLSDNAITTGKIADNTITAGDLATGSVTSDEISDATVTTTDILNGTITATDIANTQVVKSLNTLKDDVTLVAGSNITITPSGNNLTIASTSSGIGGSGTSSYLPKFTSGSTIGNSMLYESGGKLGINNTTLQYKLELGNTSENINHLRINSSQWGGLLFYNGTGDASGGITYGHLTNSMFFYSKPDGGTMTSRMALDKNGNLGIGTNNPTYKLELGEITDANNYVRVNSSSNGGLLCYDGEGYASGLIAYNHVNDRFNFYTRNGSDFQLKMVLNKYGRVGLGIVDPGAKLQVVATEKYAGNFSSDSLSLNTHVIHSEFTGSGYYDAKAVYGYSKPAVEFGYGGYFEGGYTGVYGSGKYGVYGYANVGGSIRYGIYGRALGGSTNYGIYADGDLAYTGNLINASDIMLKQNINSFSALNKISQLKPRVFSYTSDSRYNHMNLPSGNHYGLIAQDLEKVFPELVIDAVHPSAEETRGERGGEEIHYKGVKYMELVPILIQAVQEQQKIIEELTKRIEELERK